MASARISSLDRLCGSCGRGPARKVCGSCHMGNYCNSTCQKKHWKEHKSWCLRIKTYVAPPLKQPRVWGPETKEIEVMHLVDVVDYWFRQVWMARVQTPCLDKRYHPRTRKLEVLVQDSPDCMPRGHDKIAWLKEQGCGSDLVAQQLLYTGTCTLFCGLLHHIWQRSRVPWVHKSSRVETVFAVECRYTHPEAQSLHVVYSDGQSSGIRGSAEEHAVLGLETRDGQQYLLDMSVSQFCVGEPVLIEAQTGASGKKWSFASYAFKARAQPEDYAKVKKQYRPLLKEAMTYLVKELNLPVK